jgi:hypothetical protein
MRKSVLANAVITAAVVAGALSAGAVSAATGSQAAVPSAAKSKTLVFGVVFSTHTVVESNTDNPEAPIALGDEAIFHDQLFSHSQHVGDTVGSCVVVGLAPDFPNNCSAVFRVPGGSITAQFATAPGPGGKPIALTGGTGIYRNAGGDGTLVEFGNGTGSLTLRVLSLVPRGGGA